MAKRVPLLPFALVATAIATLPGGAAPGTVAAPEHASCDRAVIVGRVLRCDDDAPRRIADVCGDAHPMADLAVAAGDRVDPWAVCVLGLAAGHGRMDVVALEALAQPTDLNRASPTELEGLPGIGPALARRIVGARPFDSVDALAEVRGVGPRTLDRLRARVVVSAPP